MVRRTSLWLAGFGLPLLAGSLSLVAVLGSDARAQTLGRWGRIAGGLGRYDMGVLNDELARRTLEPGVRGGLIEGRRWRATIRRSSLPGAAAAETGRTLLEARISVEVGAGKTLEIDTMRIGSGGTQ